MNTTNAAHTVETDPWMVRKDGDEFVIVRANAILRETAEIARVYRVDKVGESHAYLFAAVRALLAALESQLKWIEQMKTVNRTLPGMDARENEARAAIAQARRGTS